MEPPVPAVEDELMAPAPGPTPGGPDTGCSVVLVEDHPVLRRRFSGQLAEAGLRVVAAVGSLRAGHDAVLTHRPDVVVVASGLPDGRGVDLCRVLRHALPQVILLLHSGLITAVDECEALDAGVVAVVPKAIRGSGLVSAVLAHARAPGRRRPTEGS
jgi:DNA-binding response OmpR family regulator